MKILVPTDFSENAAHAYRFALALAVQKQASIRLVYTFTAVYDFAAQATEIVAGIEAEAEQALEQALAIGREAHVEVAYKIVQGTVATAVTAMAYREDFDLIVMGTQGASGLKKALMGSNTGQVIKEAMTPVLAIPAGAPLPERWSFTVSTALHPEDVKFFRKWYPLVQGLAAEFSLLHIYEGFAHKAEDRLAEFSSQLEDAHPDWQARLELRAGEKPEEVLNGYLAEHPERCLVMFYQKKSFFAYLFNQSHSLQMAYHTRNPLWIVK
ncbi:MAG: universal stress protein [Nitritalea sp.]